MPGVAHQPPRTIGGEPHAQRTLWLRALSSAQRQRVLLGSDWRTQAAIVLVMGMRPCSGAIMVLLFSKLIGVFIWGVISALAMALDTSLSISLLALLVHYSRQLAMHLSP